MNPQFNLKRRAELFDQDYIHKLSEDEKEWLNRFNEEYNNANFKHSGDLLHTTSTLKKDCYDRNNSRNRDLLTLAKVMGRLWDLRREKADKDGEFVDETAEDKMIAKLDSPVII